jgi:uncharacterized protein YyaL (SSP411 family)
VNRLAAEQSPYLLQHQDNPVDWYPWGSDAFEQARRENRPIFLSIGYSTCHWCHVMAHESFENPRVAEVLNRHFVSIKVDREERPDVDRVYMTFVRATTGSGGWPMSVWLTPTLEPFHGGTYFPPTSRWGRPGFVEVLEEIARMWREEREHVTRSAGTIVGRLRKLGRRAGAFELPGPDVLLRAVEQFASAFDGRRGGFGDAPKFPRPSELLFLLREYARTGDVLARDMALLTLRAMALGGMRDHLGGGFHRYSVDGGWRVPHFEKMLYDQAQLVLAYLDAAQATGDRFWSEVAADTLAYVRRDLGDVGGGFCSAEDADSVPPDQAANTHAHKTEGAFYIWHNTEIGVVLGEEADPFRLRFGVLPDGNAPSDPHGEFSHLNLLYAAYSVEEVATLVGQPAEEVGASLARSRERLAGVRSGRPRPYRDDKVLTAWNGLAIAAFARAARVLRGGPWLASAVGAARFLRQHMWDDARGMLLRRYRQGEAGIEAYAEDYAYLVHGLLELLQATGEPEWLSWALSLQRQQDVLFWDEAEAGWFSTTGTDPTVLLRLKEDHDGAEPAASSVATLNLLTIAHLTGDGEAASRAERTLTSFGGRLAGMGRSVPMMLAALSTWHTPVLQIVVVGPAGRGDTQALLAEVNARYMPGALLLPVAPSAQDALGDLLPWVRSMGMRDGRATAYVCRDFVCQAPVTESKALRAQLEERHGISG